MTAHKQATAALKTAGFATNADFRVYNWEGKTLLVQVINDKPELLLAALVDAGFELSETVGAGFIVKVAA